MSPTATAFVLAATLGLSACASTSSTEPAPRRSGQPARLAVDNPGPDTWDVRVDGEARGSVGPRSRTNLGSALPGRCLVRLSNARTGLFHTLEIDLPPGGEGVVTVPPLLARLRVDNPHADTIDVALDGVTVGLAPPMASTVFEAVPAGKRMLILKSTVGPGAIREELLLPPDQTVTVVVGPLAAPPVAPELPRPPNGQGLVRMRNTSRLAVTLFVNGDERGLVAPGGQVDLILAPGSHELEVRIEGLEARTLHRVTLRPNQAAEWVWGEQ